MKTIHFSVVLFAICPTVPVAAQDRSGNTTKRQAELLRLEKRLSKNPLLAKGMYRDLTSFRMKYPGTKEAVRAAVLLARCVSPLDKLMLKKEHRIKELAKIKGLVQVLGGHRRAVSALAFSPNGQRLATAAWDNKLCLWQLDGANMKLWARLEGSPSQIAFSADGKYLAAGASGTGVNLWTLRGKTPKVYAKLAGHESRPFAVGFSPNGNILATGNADPMMRVWLLDSKEPEAWAAFSELGAPNYGVASISISADSKWLAVGSLLGKRSLRLWDIGGSYMKELKFPQAHARLVRFSPDGTTLLTAKADGTVNIWHIQKEKFKRGRTLIGKQPALVKKFLKAAVFSPSGNCVATAGGGNVVKLWAPATGKALGQWTFPSAIGALAFAPDGRHLAAAGRNGVVFIVRLKVGFRD